MSIGHPIEISLVIPTFNEEGNVLRLYDEIKQVLLELHIAHYEVIFIDDGSSDASLEPHRRTSWARHKCSFFTIEPKFWPPTRLKGRP